MRAFSCRPCGESNGILKTWGSVSLAIEAYSAPHYAAVAADAGLEIEQCR